MRLGISYALPHSSPDEWGRAHRALGLGAVVFPVNCLAARQSIDDYAAACRDNGLTIAEVGVWKNVFSPDEADRRAARDFCMGQLELAEYLGANCCVNVAGARGPAWDSGYADNYSQRAKDELVEFVQMLLDKVRPAHTAFALEPMPWMLPDGPQSCLELMALVDRPGFAAHMDVVNMINCPARYFNNHAFIDECFDALDGRIVSCHVKDTLMTKPLTLCLHEVPCGCGALDIARYAMRADAQSHDMPFIIEHLKTEQEYVQATQYIERLCADNGIALL